MTLKNVSKNRTLLCASKSYHSKVKIVRNCDNCVTLEACGFTANKTKTGYCLPRNETQKCKNASDASLPWANEPTWSTGICETQYTFLPIISVVIYLCAFAIGYAPLPWVLNAEFYPLWARSICVSVSTSVNWIFNLIVSMTFLSLAELAKRYGVFLVYAVITAIAFVFFYTFVPETCGCSIDEVQYLFMSESERKRRLNEEDKGAHNFPALCGTIDNSDEPDSSENRQSGYSEWRYKMNRLHNSINN